MKNMLAFALILFFTSQVIAENVSRLTSPQYAHFEKICDPRQNVSSLSHHSL